MEAPKHIRRVIWASSLGTLIEWYDFYIFGSLATVIATQFFPKTNPTAALLSVLATFAAGFIVRPFGALVFGRIGDIVGRKYTFLLTLIIMGGSTFAIGLVPGYASIGAAAPIIVLVLRLLQGLALGGEYGGAATYVAEHAPPGRRGFYTSWIQTTGTMGLVASLVVVLLCRAWLDDAAFADSVAASARRRGPIAPSVLAARLRERGVAPKVAQAAAERHGVSGTDEAAALVQKLLPRQRGTPLQIARRLAATLARRGFDDGTIAAALRRSDLPVDSDG